MKSTSDLFNEIIPLGRLIHMVNQKKDRLLNEYLSPLDITAAQFKVLCSIRCAACITPVELKKVLSVDLGALTRMLDRLVCKGWIEIDKKRYMLLAITAFASGFIAIPLVNNVTLVVLFFALINCAYSVFATVLKAWFADNLSSTSKTKIFSINYTMLNIGWTVGPPLGTLLVMQSINLPFWLAAICSAFPMFFIQIWVKRSEKIIATETGSVWSPKVLLQDKALLWFTCSGFLASFVSGAFASCISQYVMVIADGDFAEKVVAVVLPVNAAMVVTLQYSVGRRLNPANIRALMTAGTLCFVIGLIGFIFSGNSLLLWGMSAAVFTVGEIIYAPGEYMLIDHIAPPGMKASYFSAQSLGWLGAAVNPLVSGVVLTTLPSSSLFIILALVIIAAWALMLKGINARPQRQPALC